MREYFHVIQKAFHKDVLWLHDTGVLARLKDDITRSPPLIPNEKVRRDQPLIMSQLGIVVIILAVGHVLSLPVFFCELMVGRGRKTSDLHSRDSSKPAEGEYDQMYRVGHLTLLHYGRDLQDYL